MSSKRCRHCTRISLSLLRIARPREMYSFSENSARVRNVDKCSSVRHAATRRLRFVDEGRTGDCGRLVLGVTIAVSVDDAFLAVSVGCDWSITYWPASWPINVGRVNTKSSVSGCIKTSISAVMDTNASSST